MKKIVCDVQWRVLCNGGVVGVQRIFYSPQCGYMLLVFYTYKNED